MASAKTISGGVIAAAISPRRQREQSLDLAASLELLDFLHERGVDGVALLGSTGEFVHFMLEDRARMLDFAVRRSRSPILVNVSHSTLDGALYLAEEAAGSGAAGVMIMPPYYFRYDQAAIRAFCLKFGEVVAQQTPVYLYNIPVFSNPLELGTIFDLLATGLFAGVKDSSGDWQQLSALIERHPAKILNGDDRLMCRTRMAGADGCVSGVACAIPELQVALSRAVVSGDHGRAATLDGYLQEFLDWVDRFPTPVAIRRAARVRGVNPGEDAIPLGDEAQRELDRFTGWFRDWLPGVLAAC